MKSIISILFLAFPALVLAQETGTGPATIALTLEKAEELALAGNPHIHAADYRVAGAEKQVLPSLMPADPVFMIDKGGESGDPLNFGTGQEMWMVEENLGFPGKGIVQADVKGAEAGQARADARGTRLSVLYQARQAYWEFYYRTQVDSVLQEVQAQWKVLNQALQAKELTGQWLSVKTVRLQMESAQAVNELVANSRGLRISQFNLNHLFSLPHFTAYRLEGEEPLPELTAKEEDLVQKALRTNPEILASIKAAQAQESRKTLALMDHLPDLTLRLSGTRDPNGAGFSDYGFRLGVSLPLFFPAKQTQMFDAASEELAADQMDLQGKRNEVIHMVEEAYVDAASMGRLLDLYEKGGLRQQVERAWKAAQVEYRNEEMPLLDYVMTYNSYVETLTRYYQAKADYGKALAELDYRVGGMKGEDR